jgi:predicted alpha/beta hydrolase family esterase
MVVPSMRMLAFLLAAAVAAGCGGGGSPPRAPTRSATVAAAVQQPARRCGSPDMPARIVSLKTADGVTLDGAELGAGTHGVVFLHESPGDLCVWWPFARAIARGGVNALLLDLRCFGVSQCPSKQEDPAADVAAAVAELERRGARSVVVVGASYGGACALVAASKLGGRVAGVASVSGEEDLRPDLDVPAVIGRLRAPLLLLVARGDGYVSVPQMRTMLRRAGSRRKRLIVRPASAGHGTQMLVGDDGMTPNADFATLMRFVHSA